MSETVRLNQGLPDRRFTVDWSEAARTARLRDARTRLEEALRRANSRSPEARLNAVIAEAEEQARLLEASAPSRERWTKTTLGILLLALIATISLGAAGYLMWVRR